MKNTFIRKLITIFVISTTLLTILPIGVSAEWRHNSDKTWSYLDSNGNVLKDSWIGYNGEDYYLDRNGIMKTNGWVKDVNGKWFYFNTDGSMAKNTTVNRYVLGSDGALIGNTNSSTNTTENNLPITVPSSWTSLGDKKYSINGRSVFTYDIKDMTGWKQEDILKDIRQVVYKDGNYDRITELKTYNGNNAYVYSYTTFENKSLRKYVIIAIFKYSKMYSFIIGGDYYTMDSDRQELENVLNTSLVL